MIDWSIISLPESPMRTHLQKLSSLITTMDVLLRGIELSGKDLAMVKELRGENEAAHDALLALVEFVRPSIG